MLRLFIICTCNNTHPIVSRIQIPVLERLLAHHPVVVLHGARQTGKTTECPGIRDAKNLRLFLEKHPEAPFPILACECEAPTAIASTVLAIPIPTLLLN